MKDNDTCPVCCCEIQPCDERITVQIDGKDAEVHVHCALQTKEGCQ